MSSKKLFLHIGTAKTGTTSIQRLIALNKRLLADHSVFVPDFFGKVNHRLAQYAFQSLYREDGLTQRKGGVGNVRENQQLQDDIKKLWKDKVDEIELDTWLISSEHFQSRLVTEREIGDLWDFVGRLYGEIKVVVYLRDPVSAAYSSFSTAVKCGALPKSFDVKPGKFDNNCNHKKILERWLKVIPKECFDVRLFDQKRFVGNDLSSDFLSALNIDLADLIEIPARENESLSLQALRLAILVNSKIPLYLDNSINPDRANLNSYLIKYFAGFPSLSPSVAKVSEFDNYYQDSIEYVRENFFPTEKGRLWSLPKSVDDHDFAIKFSGEEEQFANLICSIWRDKQQRINLLTNEQK